MTRVLCLADVHLGVGSEYGARPGDRLADQERVLNQVADLVQDENVDHLLVAGDLFHRPKPTPAELLVAQRFLRRMKVGVTIIPGNHDYAAASDPVVLGLFADKTVAVHTTPCVDQIDQHVALAVLPWSPPSRVYANMDEDRIDAGQSVADLLAEVAAGLRAQITDGPAVLCLHWSVSGAVSSTGALADDFREPVLSASALEAQGWDAIVCGHIHKPQWIGTGPGFYCGSPNVCDFGESGHEHGVWILDVDAPDSTCATFVKLTDRPFVTIDDLDAPYSAADLDGAVVRVRYTATPEEAREIDHDVIRQMALGAGAHKVYAIQPTIVQADRARSAAVTDETGPTEAVDAYIASRELDSATSEQLRVRTPDFLERAR